MILFRRAGSKKMERKIVGWMIAVVMATLPAPQARAGGGDSIDAAARASGVPRRVIEQIIRVESGGYPYCINTNSEIGSFRFSTKKAAMDALETLLKKGYRNIDVGVAQINLRWHPDLYAKPAELLDPRKNILAAGQVLKKNREAGASSLESIVGRYHSARPSLAKKYAAIVLGKN
jgi:soluble lytic murein transglycosylase-like protein